MAETLGEGALLLIGIDRIKNPAVVLPAYDDAQGVTAEFNLNLLRRINRELMGTIPVEAFRHAARWNDAEARIEMHLEAMRAVSFTIADRDFTIGAGEIIHTENSFKYGPRDASAPARRRLDADRQLDRSEPALWRNASWPGRQSRGAVKTIGPQRCVG
jgi:L-histidine N-alpha-methyltransferase